MKRFGVILFVSLFILGAILSFQSNSDKQSNELSLLERKHTNQEIYNVSSGDFFSYNIGSDIYRFDIPEGYGDATLLYEEILEDSRLKLPRQLFYAERACQGKIKWKSTI